MDRCLVRSMDITKLATLCYCIACVKYKSWGKFDFYHIGFVKFEIELIFTYQRFVLSIPQKPLS